MKLIGVDRTSKKHSWANFYGCGKTKQVGLDHVHFSECISKPRQSFAEVMFEEKPCEYDKARIETHATIYGTAQQINMVCVSLGIGTIKNPSQPEPDKDGF